MIFSCNYFRRVLKLPYSFVQELKLKTGQALVIVAHPDDETIWMGGTILENPQLDWTIFALCRASDPDRAPKFQKVCRHYGAPAIIADLEDEAIMNVNESILKIQKIIKQKIGNKSFDYIFTHGPKGEYSHPRHIGVYLAVKQMIKSRALECRKLYNFSYRIDKNNRIYNDPQAKFFTKFSRGELIKKRNIIKNLYGFRQRSFENISCLGLETFNSR